MEAKLRKNQVAINWLLSENIELKKISMERSEGTMG